MYTVVLMIALSGSGDVAGHGRNDCSGGCCGGAYYSGYYGGCSGASYGGYGCRGGYGCHGGYYGGCQGYAANWGYGCCGGGLAPMAAPVPHRTPGAAAAPAPATILVSLPADAKLTIDGAPTSSISTRRLFVSPLLPPGKDFVYVFRAEMVRDGQPTTVSKRVIIRGGQETSVQLEAPAATAVGQ